ncbi:MAG TPA: hypothetical protein VE521_00300 [Nitrososphaera sp.]|nr:hypothetical protein [Nitrososphaera sp.]
MSDGIKKVTLLPTAIKPAAILRASTSLMTGAAYAQQGLYFVGQPTASVRDNVLTVSGEVAGAGHTVEAILTGKAIVTQGCIDKCQNERRGLHTTTEEICVVQPFNTIHGRGTFTLEFEATADRNFECPSTNMWEGLVDVGFTDLVLTVTPQTGKHNIRSDISETSLLTEAEELAISSRCTKDFALYGIYLKAMKIGDKVKSEACMELLEREIRSLLMDANFWRWEKN